MLHREKRATEKCLLKLVMTQKTAHTNKKAKWDPGNSITEIYVTATKALKCVGTSTFIIEVVHTSIPLKSTL